VLCYNIYIYIYIHIHILLFMWIEHPCVVVYLLICPCWINFFIESKTVDFQFLERVDTFCVTCCLKILISLKQVFFFFFFLELTRHCSFKCITFQLLLTGIRTLCYNACSRLVFAGSTSGYTSCWDLRYADISSKYYFIN
jgi:hypothetical protein